MQIQIKKTIKAGNSSAVILPRAWLNQQVKVELVKKTPEIILSDTLSIIKNYVNLSEVIGIYLTGSYARGEESQESDIDILVITRDTDKEIIKESSYNILLISQGLLMQKLKKDLLPIGQMIRETKPLLNSLYLDSIEVNATKQNTLWYVETTKDKLNLIKKIIDKAKSSNIKMLSGEIAYTLVLRIRTLHIIQKIKNSKSYSKNEFTKLIREIAGNNPYKSYLDVKNDSHAVSPISLNEVEKLYHFLREQLNATEKILSK